MAALDVRSVDFEDPRFRGLRPNPLAALLPASWRLFLASFHSWKTTPTRQRTGWGQTSRRIPRSSGSSPTISRLSTFPPTSTKAVSTPSSMFAAQSVLILEGKGLGLIQPWVWVWNLSVHMGFPFTSASGILLYLNCLQCVVCPCGGTVMDWHPILSVLCSFWDWARHWKWVMTCGEKWGLIIMFGGFNFGPYYYCCLWFDYFCLWCDWFHISFHNKYCKNRLVIICL